MTLPHVTCVMTAFNYERYVTGALRSVLEQDYPPGLLDVVVVDDGSTDGTAAAIRAVQAGAPGRVMLLSQENAGLAAATDAALRHARGELVAICDADDEWLPGKVRAQAEILARRPEVSLVYGDMRVIDEHGSLLDSSFFRKHQITPRRGGVLDDLVTVNFTTNSTLMFRTRNVARIPAGSPYADYWLVVHAAAAGEVEVIERPLANYRLHSANMSFGASGDHLVREMMRELQIRRLILSGEIGDAVSAETLARAALELAAGAHSLAARTGSDPAAVVGTTDDDRVRAAAQLESGAAHHTRERRLRAWARALVADPLNGDAQLLVARMLTIDADRRITVASAQELICTPDLVAAYCALVAREEDATLVIVAAGDLEAAASALRESMSRVGVDPDACPELQLVPASAVLTNLAAEAALTSAPGLSLFPGVPRTPLGRR